MRYELKMNTGNKEDLRLKDLKKNKMFILCKNDFLGKFAIVKIDKKLWAAVEYIYIAGIISIIKDCKGTKKEVIKKFKNIPYYHFVAAVDKKKEVGEYLTN